jgi:hypothetical protein
MKERLGELHFDALLCLEDLATSGLRLSGEYLLKAHGMMTFVLERWGEMLVKEHPYILLCRGKRRPSEVSTRPTRRGSSNHERRFKHRWTPSR